MPKASIFKVSFGGLLSVLSGLNWVFGWIMAFDWLQKNASGFWGVLVNPITQCLLIVLGLLLSGTGLWEIWRFKHKSTNADSSPRTPTLDVSGDRARVVQGSNAGRDFILGDIYQTYAPRPDPAIQPQISLRILDVEVRLQPHPTTAGKTGTLLQVQVQSSVTVVFTALNSNACQTSLDMYALEITGPVGNVIRCDDITNKGIMLDAGQPPPSGVFRLESNAALSQGVTLKRFVRFLASEIVLMEDPQPVGGFRNPLEFEQLVFRARTQAYEKFGTLRLTIVDSYGITWHADWKGASTLPPGTVSTIT
jgi:hypothetical protein